MLRIAYLSFVLLLFSSSDVRSVIRGEYINMNCLNIATSDSDVKLRSIDFKQYGFRIGYPNAWIKVDGGRALFACKMNCDASRAFCPNIVLNIVLKKEGALLSNYADFFLKKVQGEFKDMELVNSVSGKVKGNSCMTIDYKMSANGTHLGATTRIVDLGKFILFVNCMGDNEPQGKYTEYRGLFEAVIESVTRM